MEWWFFEFMAILSGMFHSAPQLSANVVLANLSTITHMFPMGIGIVAQKMVGNSIGASRIEEGR